MKSLQLLYNLVLIKCSHIAMSATFLVKDLSKISELLGDKHDFEVCTSMKKRIFFLEVVMLGNPTQSTATCIKQDYQNDPDIKVIWYTISEMETEDCMVHKGESILDSLGIKGKSMLYIGDSGTAWNAFILAAFHREKELFVRPEIIELVNTDIDTRMCDEAVLKILCRTAAINCGISSDYVTARIGLVFFQIFMI